MDNPDKIWGVGNLLGKISKDLLHDKKKGNRSDGVSSEPGVSGDAFDWHSVGRSPVAQYYKKQTSQF